jgi:ABC-type Co2+ transport system permease subunit
MQVLGATLGIIVGLAILAILLWEFPKFRRDALTSLGIVIMTFATLGGWAGYQIFSMLFPAG